MRFLAGLCLLLMLAGCSIAPPAVDSTPTLMPEPSVTPTVTATIDWFPATATPTLQATQPPRLEEVDLRPGLGETILEDDFSDASNWETGQFSGATISVALNGLTIAIPGVEASVSSRRGNLDLRDFYLEIQVDTPLCRGSDNYGLLLRAASTSDFYRWIITCDGQMRLERIVGGTVAVAQNWIPAVRRPDTARLGVWFYGKDLRFFIDDIYQFGVSDPVLTAGTVAAFARSSGAEPLTVNFSDLKIRKIDPAGVAAAATPTPQPTPAASASAVSP
jgi:hypothetical protein